MKNDYDEELSEHEERESEEDPSISEIKSDD
jgi:hypothetical protein